MTEYIKLLLLIIPLVVFIVGGYYLLKNYDPECEHGEAWEEECADCERYY